MVAKSPVKLRYSFLKILTGSDLSRRRLPRMTATSPEPGPVVWLTACVHGDEVGGIVVVQEVFRGLRRRLRRGTVHAFPLLNPIGFETMSRTIPVGREDLNRAFPGDPTGSPGARLADRILGTIRETRPDLVLDLHNDWRRSIPYTVVDRSPGPAHRAAWTRTREFARRLGFVTILETEPIAGSLSGTLLREDVPALTLELGEPLVVNEAMVARGVEAVWSLLAALEMIPPLEAPHVDPVPAPYRAGRLLRYSDRPYASTTGIVRFLTRPGDAVRPGQPLARVVNAFGKHLETIRAQGEAIVLGHTDSSVVFPGMPILAFGRPEAPRASGAPAAGPA